MKDYYKILIEEASVLAAFYTGPEHTIQIANQRMLDAWSKDKSIIGMPLRSAIPELEGQPFFDYFDNVYRTGIEHVSEEESAWLPVDGMLKEFFYDFSYKPLKNDDGSVWGIIHTATDVTEQVKAKRAQQASEANFKNMVLQSPVACCIYSGPEFVLTIANPKMLEIMGKTAEESLNKPLLEGLPEVKSQGFDKILRRICETGVGYEANELPVPLPRNGKIETVYVNFTYTPIREVDGSINSVMAVAYDVTEQVSFRAKVEESEQRLQLAVDNTEAGVFDTNLITGESIRSGRHARIFGYRDNTEPWSLARMLSHVIPEDLEFAHAKLAEARIEGSVDVNLRIKKLDGMLRWINIVGKVHYNEKKEPVRMVGTTVDVTERKKLEKQKDEFISTVSHELKTPVTSIKAYSQLLRRSMSGYKNSKQQNFLERLDVQVSRLETLIWNLLDITRIDSGKFNLERTAFNMHYLLVELVEDMQVVTPSHKLIISQSDSAEVYADPNRIIQVLTNLITNAVKYSPEANEVYLSCEKSDNRVVCRIRDFGLGIPREQIKKIFERFHQTSLNNGNSGLNLGLGLYISKEIIQQYGGEIWVESSPGKGSTFSFSLPCR